MRLPLGRAALAAALLMLVSLPVRAQDPVTLPEMKVLAKMDKPGPRLLVGIVVDTGGNPIAGAEVTVPGLARRVFTGPDGTFRLDSIRKGEHTMRARKIGYAAQVRKFEVDSSGGVAAFALLPIVTALPSMVTSATRRGLSGYVGDVEMNAVEGATVRVLGAGLSTRTDVAGNFFLPAQTGRYLVSIVKDSFLTKLVSVSIPEDSGRHVNAWIMPGKIPKDEYWNVDDLRERQAWVRPRDRVLYTREDLAKMKIEWVYDAVARTNQKFGFTEEFSRDCMVVADGGPEIVNLAMLTIDDVESVEIYKAYPGALQTVSAAAPQSKNAKVKGGEFVWFNNSRRAIIENGARVCPAVYVWLK
jgi:hypothetical protein